MLHFLAISPITRMSGMFSLARKKLLLTQFVTRRNKKKTQFGKAKTPLLK
uniref:Uncharacterized protein n=1 Tax=Anopheles minimus TaxID=112268 RepID=A0A182WP22_9DIPT